MKKIITLLAITLCLSACASLQTAQQTKKACVSAPVLITDLSKPAAERHTMLPDGERCRS